MWQGYRSLCELYSSAPKKIKGKKVPHQLWQHLPKEITQRSTAVDISEQFLHLVDVSASK
jgi:hypothetical protein